jgi:hypothetical protein
MKNFENRFRIKNIAVAKCLFLEEFKNIKNEIIKNLHLDENLTCSASR